MPLKHVNLEILYRIGWYTNVYIGMAANDSWCLINIMNCKKLLSGKNGSMCLANRFVINYNAGILSGNYFN